MKKAATLREIARQANVHYATASTILNGARSSTRVSDATRHRVLAVADSLGYTANRAAQQLKTRRSRVVGLLTGGLENPFFARMVSLCSEALEERGYDVILATRRRDESSDLHLFDALVSRQFDGLLLWSETDTQVGERIASHPELAARVVVMGRAIPPCDLASSTLHEGVRAALEHLRAEGRRNIAYFAPRIALHRHGDPRPGVYQETMEEWGCPSRVFAFEGSAYDVSGARGRAEELADEIAALPVQDRPDALLCFNDMIAFGVMMGLRRRGVDIPGQIALVGCDDLPLASQIDVPLTTVAYPLAQVCHTAVEMLLERIAIATGGDSAPAADDLGAMLPPSRERLFEARLVIRESSRTRKETI